MEKSRLGFKTPDEMKKKIPRFFLSARLEPDVNFYIEFRIENKKGEVNPNPNPHSGEANSLLIVFDTRLVLTTYPRSGVLEEAEFWPCRRDHHIAQPIGYRHGRTVFGLLTTTAVHQLFWNRISSFMLNLV